MAFTTDPQQTNDPSYLSYAQGTSKPEPNKSMEALFSGIGNTLDIGVTGADTAIKLDIEKQVDQGVNRIRDKFGVAEATKLAGANTPPTSARGDNSLSILGQDVPGGVNVGDAGKTAKGAPAGIAKIGTQIADTNEAYNGGFLSNSYYYAQLNSYVKQLRAQYPGYEKEIDTMIAEKVGTTPANALRKSVLDDLDAAARAKQNASSHDQNFIDSHAQYLGGDQYQQLQKGQLSIQDAKLQIVNRLGQEHNIKTARDGLAFSKDKEADIEHRAGQVATNHADTYVAQAIADMTRTQGVQQVLDKWAENPASVGPKDVESANTALRNLRLSTQQGLGMIFSGRDPKTGESLLDANGNSYNTYLKEKADGIQKNAMGQIDAMEQALNKGEYSVVKSFANRAKTMEDAATARVLEKFPVLQNWAAISKISGPNANLVLQSSGVNLTGLTSALNDAFKLNAAAPQGSLGSATGSSSSFKVDLDKALPSLSPTDQKNLTTTASQDMMKIITEGADKNPRQAASTANYFFGPQNLGFLNRFSKNSWPQVYNDHTNTGVTEAVEKLSKTDPSLTIKYQKWSVDAFGTVFQQSAQNLQEAIKANLKYTVDFDPKSNVFFATPNDAVKGTNPQISTQFLRNSGGVAPEINRQIQTMNAAVRNLVPIIEMGGTHAAKDVLPEIFKSMGLNLKQPEEKTPVIPAKPDLLAPQPLEFQRQSPKRGVSVEQFLSQPTGSQSEISFPGQGTSKNPYRPVTDLDLKDIETGSYYIPPGGKKAVLK